MNDNTFSIFEAFVDKIFHLTSIDFSDDVVHQAKRCLLDYIGITLAGSTMLADKLNQLKKAWRPAKGDCIVIGKPWKTDIAFAGFVNGLSAHVAELDDGSNEGIVHPGSPVISALISLASGREISPIDLLKGIVIGYEATISLAVGIQPAHKLMGFHATGTCGTIGASSAVATMLKYPKDVFINAISAGVLSASGMLKVLEDDSELKPYNVGRASMNGLLSAMTAEAGFVGPKDAFIGKSGMLSMMSDYVDEVKLLNIQSQDLKIFDIYVKPHAACRYCHPSIDAALAAGAEMDKTDIINIDSIQIKTYNLAVKNHDHTAVNSISSAKMSIPYSVAIALETGKAGINEFSNRYVMDPVIKALTRKISVESDNEMSNSFPEESIASISVFLRNGKVIVHKITIPLGEPVNPLSDKQLEEKLISLATFAGKSMDDCRRIIDIVWDVESSLPELFRYL